DDELEWSFHLVAVRFRRPEFWRLQHCLEHIADVPVFFGECLRHTIDQGLRWLVGNKTHCQFRADKPGSRRVLREDMQNLETLLLAFWLDAVAENSLVSGFVGSLVEGKAPALLGLL